MESDEKGQFFGLYESIQIEEDEDLIRLERKRLREAAKTRRLQREAEKEQKIKNDKEASEEIALTIGSDLKNVEEVNPIETLQVIIELIKQNISSLFFFFLQIIEN
jgi:hypothetical protein